MRRPPRSGAEALEFRPALPSFSGSAHWAPLSGASFMGHDCGTRPKIWIARVWTNSKPAGTLRNISPRERRARTRQAACPGKPIFIAGSIIGGTDVRTPIDRRQPASVLDLRFIGANSLARRHDRGADPGDDNEVARAVQGASAGHPAGP